MISSTRVNGRYALRLCILNHRTTAADVDRVLDWLESAPLDDGAALEDASAARSAEGARADHAPGGSR